MAETEQTWAYWVRHKATDSQLREIQAYRDALAERAKALEKALEHHKHTDECMAYAVKTARAGSGYHCIAKCATSLRVALDQKDADDEH